MESVSLTGDHVATSGLTQLNTMAIAIIVITGDLDLFQRCEDGSCTRSGQFYRQLESPAKDGIELRVCRDQYDGDEIIGIRQAVVYVHK